MRVITITIDEGKIEVVEDGRTTGQLSWDEMLGMVAELTHPKIGVGRYPMMTAQEWEEREQKQKERLAGKLFERDEL